jgi:hypothetical protein
VGGLGQSDRKIEARRRVDSVPPKCIFTALNESGGDERIEPAGDNRKSPAGVHKFPFDDLRHGVLTRE